MKEKLRFFMAGIFIGVSELLPGISGATVALMFGVYEKILNFLSKFKDLNLMIPLFVGMLLSVFVFSSIINFLYENYTNAFNLFIGILMIGYGLLLLVNTYLEEQINKGIIFYTVLALSFLIGYYLSSFELIEYKEPNQVLLIIYGLIACSFLLFPGISGSAFLLSVGIYPLIIGSIANFNLNILFPFAMGMLIALAVMPRLINMVYEKFGRVILVFFGGLIFVAGINSFL